MQSCRSVGGVQGAAAAGVRGVSATCGECIHLQVREACEGVYKQWVPVSTEVCAWRPAERG